MSSNAPRLTITNASLYQSIHPNTTTTATIPVTRSTIDDFREIVREQSFITPTNSDYNPIDVPKKIYPPLPDIHGPNTSMTNTFFRTEAILASPKPIHAKKQVFNHFASTQRGPLPALSKSRMSPTMSNVMDLDEDLPQGAPAAKHRAATYTSPGERIISPIKRPSAPIPPTSAQVKRSGPAAFPDDEDDQDDQDDEYYSDVEANDSQYFEEHFRPYQQPNTLNSRRIDHYSQQTHQPQTGGKRPTIVVTDGHDDGAHPMDSIDFQPFT